MKRSKLSKEQQKIFNSLEKACKSQQSFKQLGRDLEAKRRGASMSTLFLLASNAGLAVYLLLNKLEL